jgi:hypothetical protein
MIEGFEGPRHAVVVSFQAPVRVRGGIRGALGTTDRGRLVVHDRGRAILVGDSPVGDACKIRRLRSRLQRRTCGAVLTVRPKGFEDGPCEMGWSLIGGVEADQVEPCNASRGFGFRPCERAAIWRP